MKHLYVLMLWPEDMDMLWIKFLSFVSVSCSVNLSFFVIVLFFNGKHRFHYGTLKLLDGL